MSLVLNTNMAAMNASRNLATTQSQQATTFQRLSTGLRINSAKDDAAGLYLAQSQTKDIRGLNMATRNAADGISMAQTAEGAMDQITMNLQRVNELAIQSANGTYNDAARDGLQKEVDQLTQEIARIISVTEFNGKPLMSYGADKTTFQVGFKNNEDSQIDLDFAGGIVGAIGGWDADATPPAGTNIDVTDPTAPSLFGDALLLGNAHTAYLTAKNAPEYLNPADPGHAAAVTAYNTALQDYQDEIAGADADALATFSLFQIVAGELDGTKTIDISTQEMAQLSISKTRAAIDAISGERATFGAQMNRFEAVISGNNIYSENLSAARSRIQDADFAVETSNLAKQQVLQQAGVASLSQANQASQVILGLL